MGMILDGIILRDTKTGISSEYDIQDSQLKARFERLIANSGDTGSNSELIDIRVGADGKQYTTAGQAVREQVTGLQNQVDELNKDGLILNDSYVSAKIDNWLAHHPEATTTVVDGSITKEKLEENFLYDIRKARYYNSIEDMKLDTELKPGQITKTLGYYSPNDGGGGTYIIRVATESDTDDGGSIHKLDNGLVAELIINGEKHINIRTIGATEEEDIAPFIRKYIDTYNNKTLYIPSGIWKCSSLNIIKHDGFRIVGDYSFIHSGYALNGTIITSLNDNQSYILKIGSKEDVDIYDRLTTDFELKGITFSTINDDKTVYNIESALVLECCCFGKIDVNFSTLLGTSLTIKDSWELYLGDLNFRNIGDFTKPIVKFAKSTATTSSGSDISDCFISTMMFEACDGDYIHFESGNKLSRWNIGAINTEVSKSSCGDGVFDAYNSDFTVSNSILHCEEALALSIGTIQATFLGYKTYAVGEEKFCNNCVIKIPNSANAIVNINCIQLFTYGANVKICQGTTPNPRTKLSILGVDMYSEPFLGSSINFFDFEYFSKFYLGNCNFTNFVMHPIGTECYKLAYSDVSNNNKLLITREDAPTPAKIGVKMPVDKTANRYFGIINVKPTYNFLVYGNEGDKFRLTDGTNTIVGTLPKDGWNKVSLDTSTLGVKCTLYSDNHVEFYLIN